MNNTAPKNTAPKNTAASNTAVVVGASVAGLAAARILADHYESVIVVERDELPDSNAPRHGVPQSAHSHVLVAAGLREFERLMPGLQADLRLGRRYRDRRRLRTAPVQVRPDLAEGAKRGGVHVGEPPDARASAPRARRQAARGPDL